MLLEYTACNSDKLYILPNRKDMKGTQVQSHVITWLEQTTDKTIQETPDMSKLADNNFRILELFSSS